jgi:glyoxylase-like metal-dependent hydrolase (beta-lactamase superfamily II)
MATSEPPRSSLKHAAPGIAPFTLGPFGTNCYVVTPSAKTDGSPCWIVDASFEPDELIEHVRDNRLTPNGVLLTHTHVDHIAGVADIRRAFPGVPILVHPAECGWLTDPMLNLSGAYGMPVTAPEATDALKDGDKLTLGADTWTVLHMPGHSPGGITLLHEPSGTALVGDTLFHSSVGRTDFPGSSFEELARSIRTKLYTLPDETRVYPGHGPATTIGREKRNNPFVRPE